MSSLAIITMMLLAASAIFSLYRQLKVLQKRDYSLKEYLKWIYNSYFVELAISAVIYCATMFLMIRSKTALDIIALVLAILLLLARIALNFMMDKNATEKLAFTARVKSIYIAAIVILGALTFVSWISFDNTTKITGIGDMYLISNNVVGEAVRTVCVLLSVVTPVITIVSWLVTLPVEKIFAKKGSHDTTRVLDEKIVDDAQETTEQQEDDLGLSYESLLKNYTNDEGTDI